MYVVLLIQKLYLHSRIDCIVGRCNCAAQVNECAVNEVIHGVWILLSDNMVEWQDVVWWERFVVTIMFGFYIKTCCAGKHNPFSLHYLSEHIVVSIYCTKCLFGIIFQFAGHGIAINCLTYVSDLEAFDSLWQLGMRMCWAVLIEFTSLKCLFPSPQLYFVMCQ